MYLFRTTRIVLKEGKRSLQLKHNAKNMIKTKDKYENEKY